MGWFSIASYLSELFHPIWGATMLVEPAVDDTLVVGIDRAEDTGKDLEWEFIPKPELDPKTSRAEAIERNLPEVFRGNLNLLLHLVSPSLMMSNVGYELPHFILT